MINKNDLRLNILLLMMIFVSWQNFQIGGVYFFIIFELLYCIISFFCKNKRECPKVCVNLQTDVR